MEIKATMKYHLRPVRITITRQVGKLTSVDKDVEKMEPMYTVDGNVK